MQFTTNNIDHVTSTVATLNKKAAKLKQAPVVLKVLNVVGNEVTVEVTGNAPHIAGWDFVAQVKWDYSQPIIKTMSDDIIAPENSVCEHCGTSRNRSLTYLLQNKEGRIMQVGSSCIKDFVDAPITFVTQFYKAFASMVSADDYGYSPSPYVSVADALVRACESVRRIGYHGTSSEIHTADTLMEMKDPSADDFAKAKAIIAYIASCEASGNYMRNLKVLCAERYVHYKELRMLVSAVAVYDKYIADEAKKAALTNEYYGCVGDKFKTKATVVTNKIVNSFYGVSHLVVFATPEGNLLKWFTSSEREEKVGDELTLWGRIKSHEDYKGQKATMVTRCKVELS